MSKKTIALIVSLVVLTGALLVIALTAKPASDSSNQTQTASKNINEPTPTPPAQTLLMLNPNPLTATIGQNTISVDINSGSNAITTIQLELAYDPKLISNVKITPGDFLTGAVEILNSNDTTTGRYTYVIGKPPSQSNTGKGTVAKISFNARTATAITKETELTLLPKSLVAASNISASVLKDVKSAKIILPTSGAFIPQNPIQPQPQTTAPPTQ